MKSLIIDLSCKGEVKILHAKIKSTISIQSGYYLTLSPSDDPISATAAKLREEELLGLPSFIIPPVEVIEKHNFLLPKMPDKEIKKVLPREIAEVADSSETMSYNYLKNGMVEDRQKMKMEIAAFYCTQQRMFEFLNQFKAEGIDVTSIIPEVQGLKTLAEINPGLSDERTGVVFLDMMDTRINLNIFKNKDWGLERDFLYRMGNIGEDDDLKDEDFTRISTELNRTFQYFKQRNRNFTIDKVVLYGTGSHLENLKNLINDNHPVTAGLVDADHFGSKVSLPSHLKDSQEFISIFALTIATALSVSGKKYLDLYPIVYKEKARMTSRVIGLVVAASIIGAILIGSSIYFENIKAGYRNDISKIQETYDSMNQNATTIVATKKQRTDFFKRRYFLDFPLQYSYASANFVRKLSNAATDEVELLELAITPSGQTVKFKLDGRIKASDNIGAQSRFLQFYRKLKEFENILDVSSSKVAINPREGNSSMDGDDTGDNRDNGDNKTAPQKKKKWCSILPSTAKLNPVKG